MSIDIDSPYENLKRSWILAQERAIAAPINRNNLNAVIEIWDQRNKAFNDLLQFIHEQEGLSDVIKTAWPVALELTFDPQYPCSLPEVTKKLKNCWKKAHEIALNALCLFEKGIGEKQAEELMENFVPLHELFITRGDSYNLDDLKSKEETKLELERLQFLLNRKNFEEDLSTILFSIGSWSLSFQQLPAYFLNETQQLPEGKRGAVFIIDPHMKRLQDFKEIQFLGEGEWEQVSPHHFRQGNLDVYSIATFMPDLDDTEVERYHSFVNQLKALCKTVVARSGNVYFGHHLGEGIVMSSVMEVFNALLSEMPESKNYLHLYIQIGSNLEGSWISSPRPIFPLWTVEIGVKK